MQSEYIAPLCENQEGVRRCVVFTAAFSYISLLAKSTQVLKFVAPIVRIPQEKVDQVRDATDIVDLIGAFVKLKKRGKNFVGLCPFHSEKTPSFNVSPERQMYHCFGCGVGGNVFTFVMEFEKVSFIEAVRSLAEKAGIVLPQGSAGEDEAASEQENLYQLCREAGLFYYKALTESGEGKFALEYFHKRGFSDDTIRSFGLGYSPNSWDAFLKFAQQKGFPLELVEKAGLVRKRDDGSWFDYFRGRAMFPIFSPTGRVLGFGARKLREDDPLGKYINSPETAIYNKSRVLYGLSESKESIREKDFAVLVEGYADLISVFQAGIKNVVASSGTALTPDQIVLLSRYTRNITIMYDADSAGSSAALRGVDLILERDLDVRVAPLPQGDDPDSYVRKHGPKEFEQLLENAVSFVDFIAQTFERQGKLSTPEGQAQTVRTIVRTIAKMSDELKRNFYIKHVAEKYKIYESTVYREIDKILRTEKSAFTRPKVENVPASQRNGLESRPSSLPEIPRIERELIGALLRGGYQTVSAIMQVLNTEDIAHPESRRIIQKLFDAAENQEDVNPSELIDKFPESKRWLSDLIVSKHQLSKRWGNEKGGVVEGPPLKIAVDCVLKMKHDALKKLQQENVQKQKRAAARGEDPLPYVVLGKQLQERISNEMKDLELQLKSLTSEEAPRAPE